MITKPQVGMCYKATHVSMKVPLIYAHKLAPVMTPHSHYNAIFQPKTRPTPSLTFHCSWYTPKRSCHYQN